MTDDRYYIKIVPHRGDTIHRFVVRKRDAAVASVAVLVFMLTALAWLGLESARGAADRTALRQIAGQTDALHRQLQSVQRENQEITELIGAPAQRSHKLSPSHKGVSLAAPMSVAWLQAHVEAIAADSRLLALESRQNESLALRVLNLRHLQELERDRLLAFIPSIDPVSGAVVVGCFCYRTSPDVEFHEGVDLGADYGQTVRAAAAGTVASAGWDGEYGLKVDIDHGNGYHTWYAHLSRIDVSVGERVYKGENIAAVGATGFATGPHLHYQLMLDGRPIDPTPYLHGIPQAVIASLH